MGQHFTDRQRYSQNWKEKSMSHTSSSDFGTCNQLLTVEGLWTYHLPNNPWVSSTKSACERAAIAFLKCSLCYQTSFVLESVSRVLHRNLSLAWRRRGYTLHMSLTKQLIHADITCTFALWCSSYCRGTVFIEERLLKNWYRYLKDIDFI